MFGSIFRAMCITLLIIAGFSTAHANNYWNEVKDDIVSASQLTDFDVTELTSVAYVESSFRATVKSKGSSAQGLMQITGPTAAYLIERYGADFGIDENANLLDPRVSAILGSFYLMEIRDIMENRLKRKVTTTEMYLGYKFSPYRAVRMLRQRSTTLLVDFYPEAAERNQSVYYKQDGEPRTVREVYSMFDKRIKGALKKYGEVANALFVAAEEKEFEPYLAAYEQGQVDCNRNSHLLAKVKYEFEEALAGFRLGVTSNSVTLKEDTYTDSSYLNETYSISLGKPSGRTYNGFFV